MKRPGTGRRGEPRAGAGSRATPRPPATRRQRRADAGSPAASASSGSPASPVAGSRPARAHRRTTLTSRAAVLALVLCALVVMLAYPLQQYLAQRSQIARLAQANSSAQQQVDKLQAQQQLWSDPAYVGRQARERLHFVLPGETAYIVVGGNGSTTDPQSAAAAAPRSPPALGSGATWYSRLWSTVRSAGSPAPTAPRPRGTRTSHRTPAPIAPTGTPSPGSTGSAGSRG